MKMQGYSTKEIAPIVSLTTGAIYVRYLMFFAFLWTIGRGIKFPHPILKTDV